MEFLTNNWPVLIAGLWGLWQLGNAIARLTPNTTDDAWAAKAEGWLSKLASLGLKPPTK